MDLSSQQRAVLEQAQQLLDGAGLSSADLELILPSSSRSSSRLSSRSSTPSIPHSFGPSAAVVASRYLPPPARPFSQDEIDAKLHKINDRMVAHQIVIHEPNAIVEYPQTGDTPDTAVAHIFSIDPNHFVHPKSSFQYSLGNKHGGRDDVTCRLLRGNNGEEVKCHRLKTSCRGLKVCSAHAKDFATTFSHSYTSREQVRNVIAPPSFLHTAKAEVFMKTLALFCSLSEHGCSFRTNSELAKTRTEVDDSDLESEFESDEPIGSQPPGASVLIKRHRQSRRKQSDDRKDVCGGKLLMRRDAYNRHFVVCQRYTRADRAHLIIRNLQEYDIEYLSALLCGDQQKIFKHESAAKEEGYGPLVPCTVTTSPSAQTQTCPYWHRSPNGTLARGDMLSWIVSCPTQFYVYKPYDLIACPRIVVICRNPHSHAPPAPVNTPPPLEAELQQILFNMGWRLADASPRRVVLDTGFVHGLKNALGWNFDRSPSLSELHPSFANMDHVRRLIDDARAAKFPHGTDFEAIQHLVNHQSSLYVRCAETHELKSGKFTLIVCMSPNMSAQLMHAKRLSIDMSFKRVCGKWEEFEIETWDNQHMRSVVVARAFTTCESGEAHFILFSRIFEIAQQDTGLRATFHYMDGHGIESIVADGHRGQALGLGMFCVSLCRGNTMPCRYESHHRLCDLNPYDHLRRVYRLCIFHFRHNLRKLHKVVPSNVYNAMLSISSFDTHPNFDNTLRIIRSGGKKAKDWLKDKEESGFAIPALYFPKSLMPTEFWKACPTTTNGNEQAHRNINRDGINLTLLGGVMHGQDYDERVQRSMHTQATYGIQTRDQISTHTRRVSRSVSRLVQAQRQQYEKKSPSLPTIHEYNDNDSSIPSLHQPLISPQHHRPIISHSPVIDNHTTSTSTTPPSHVHSISTYSTLTNALTPGISITDYQSFASPTYLNHSIGNEQLDWTQVRVSQYSTLANALGGN